MVEYEIYRASNDRSLSEWVDGDTLKGNMVNTPLVITNAEKLLKRSNAEFGMYFINVMRGSKRQLKDGGHYDYCLGYALLQYDKNGVKILETNLSVLKGTNMKTYCVTFSRTINYSMEVKAESEYDAIDKAKEMTENMTPEELEDLGDAGYLEFFDAAEIPE